MDRARSRPVTSEDSITSHCEILSERELSEWIGTAGWPLIQHRSPSCCTRTDVTGSCFCAFILLHLRGHTNQMESGCYPSSETRQHRAAQEGPMPTDGALV